MAKDDYHVIAYRLLAYLYACLKEGATPKLEYINHDTDAFPIGKSYFDYILIHLLEDGYLEGLAVIPLLGNTKSVKIESDFMITPKGIEFLQDNSKMQKAKSFLKDLKEVIPGI